MTKLLIIALLATFPVIAQAAQLSSKPSLTDREQIQADRARAAAEEKNASTARPWDRDVDGKRPWDKPAKPAEGLPKP